MNSGVLQLLRSRGFALGINACLWLLLYLALTRFGGRSPDFHELESTSTAAQSPAPVARLAKLLAPEVWPGTVFDTNGISPFFTRHFIPPAVPTPPAPTTRKIELTYQGYFQTSEGPKQAIVKLGDAFMVASVGSNFTANLFAAEATMQTLTLTNPAAQTNLLILNTKKEIEVPIQ
jgi:hypothetical protein